MILRRILGATLVMASILSGTSFAAVLLDKVVAVVNKEVITWGELYRSMEFKAGEDFKKLSNEEKRKVFKENEANFLESMIDMKLQLQAAKKLDIDASREEVAEAVDGIRKKYSMDDREFAESLKKEGFSLEEYRKLISEQIILSKVVAQQVRNKIVVSDSDVEAYLSNNRETGFRIRQIFLRKQEKEGDRSALEARANDIYQKLMAGADFSSLAVRYSNDPSAGAGGDLGFVRKEHLGKEFLDALSGMKDGDVSKPFWTAGGVHIIKLEERADSGSADEMKESARKKLLEQRFNEEYRSWLKGLREKAFVEVRL